MQINMATSQITPAWHWVEYLRELLGALLQCHLCLAKLLQKRCFEERFYFIRLTIISLLFFCGAPQTICRGPATPLRTAEATQNPHGGEWCVLPETSLGPLASSRRLPESPTGHLRVQIAKTPP